MKVGFLNYYGPINLFSESDGTRENGNKRFLEIIKKFDEHNISYENYRDSEHYNYNLIIVSEIPRLSNLISLVIKNLIKKIPTILILEETKIARNRNILLIPRLFDAVLINAEDDKYKFKNYLTSPFSLASLPSKEEINIQKDFILNSQRMKKILYIGRNKASLNKNGSYNFRTHIIKNLSKHKDIFTLFGEGWHKRQIPMDFPFIAFINKLNLLKIIFNRILNFRRFSVHSNGVVYSKIDTQNKYDFTLAIEPFMGYPKTILEKIFDPMLSGSIPIYYGPEIEGIPADCYLRINKKTSVEDIKEIVNSLSFEDKVKYRNNIYNFLISDKANKYRYSTYANFIVEKVYQFSQKKDLEKNYF